MQAQVILLRRLRRVPQTGPFGNSETVAPMISARSLVVVPVKVWVAGSAFQPAARLPPLVVAIDPALPPWFEAVAADLAAGGEDLGVLRVRHGGPASAASASATDG